MQDKSPCYYCTEHRAGCHVPECEHGLWEWHLEQQAEKAQLDKEKQIRQGLWTEGTRKSKSKKGNILSLLHKKNYNGESSK